MTVRRLLVPTLFAVVSINGCGGEEKVAVPVSTTVPSTTTTTTVATTSTTTSTTTTSFSAQPSRTTVKSLEEALGRPRPQHRQAHLCDAPPAWSDRRGVRRADRPASRGRVPTDARRAVPLLRRGSPRPLGRLKLARPGSATTRDSLGEGAARPARRSRAVGGSGATLRILQHMARMTTAAKRERVVPARVALHQRAGAVRDATGRVKTKAAATGRSTKTTFADGGVRKRKRTQ